MKCIVDKFLGKSYFNDFISDDKTLLSKGNIYNTFDYLNIIRDGFIVQGFTVVEDYFLISAYCKEKKKSRIYFYDKSLGSSLGYVILDNSAHVGGITHDFNKKVIFVTGSFGKINAYNYTVMIDLLKENDFILDLNKINLELVKIECINFDIAKVLFGNVSAATIYYSDNSVYVGTCTANGSLIKGILNYSTDMKTLTVELKVISNNLPSCVQGLIVFSYQGQKYFIVSQSYSSLKSILKVYKVNEYKNEVLFISQKTINFIGMEGIDMDSCGNIHCIFEKKVKKTYIFNIRNLRNGINKKLENKYFLKGKIHQNKLDSRNFVV